jgi:hypothetical protein
MYNMIRTMRALKTSPVTFPIFRCIFQGISKLEDGKSILLVRRSGPPPRNATAPLAKAWGGGFVILAAAEGGHGENEVEDGNVPFIL